ncbi:MAG: hypothetical protein HY901_10405, partial [Deltaproteobacteria bacterium]|nr:hypothetical protein [Deltaproteobacteria bacterium]
EMAVHARTEDLERFSPEELVRLGVFGVLLAADEWRPEDAELVRRLREEGIAVHVAGLLGPSVAEPVEATLALEADATDFLPRLSLPSDPGFDPRGADPLDSSEGAVAGPVCAQVKAARELTAVRHGSPLVRLTRTLLRGYRGHEFSDDPWLRRRAAQSRQRLEELRLLIANTPPENVGETERRLREEVERDFALLLGPGGLGQRAVVLGSQALYEFGRVVRKVRRALDVSGTTVRHFRWTEAAGQRALAAARRAKRFAL